MIWEELKFYKPLEKSELITAKKDIENTISANLAAYGFKKAGRKLIRQKGTVIDLIHIDSRGSWLGASNSLKIEIAIISIFDTDVLVKSHEPISSIYIETIYQTLRTTTKLRKSINCLQIILVEQ